MITINPRTKLCILSDDREISITESQYLAIKADQNIWKYSDPIVIRDADTKEILFDWKIGSIKEFRDINKNNLSGAIFRCDFWIEHPIHLSCECSAKYQISPIVFRMTLFSLYPNIKYPSQVTPEIRNKVLASFKTPL